MQGFIKGIKGKGYIVVAGVVLVSSSVGLAQSEPDPNTTVGFHPNHIYANFGSESIDTLNGNLHWTIPLKAPAPGKGGSSLGLALSYNSKVWEMDRQNSCCNLEICNPGEVPYLERQGPFGLGMTMHFGVIRYHHYTVDTDCGGEPNPYNINTVFYEDPTGAIHGLAFTSVSPYNFGEGWAYSLDGSNIRARYFDAADKWIALPSQAGNLNPDPNALPGSYWLLWTPDGTRYKLANYVSAENDLGLCPIDPRNVDDYDKPLQYYHDTRKGWWVTEIRDALSGAVTTVEYDNPPTCASGSTDCRTYWNPPGCKRWMMAKVKDTVGREITFEADPLDSTRIWKINYPAFEGTTATITLGYTKIDKLYPSGSPASGLYYPNVNFLTSISYPASGLAVTLFYDDQFKEVKTCPDPPTQNFPGWQGGELTDLWTPTGAHYQYHYQNFVFSSVKIPDKPWNKQEPLRSLAHGVFRKTLTVPNSVSGIDDVYQWDWCRPWPKDNTGKLFKDPSNPNLVILKQPLRNATPSNSCLYQTEYQDQTEYIFRATDLDPSGPTPEGDPKDGTLASVNIFSGVDGVQNCATCNGLCQHQWPPTGKVLMRSESFDYDENVAPLYLGPLSHNVTTAALSTTTVRSSWDGYPWNALTPLASGHLLNEQFLVGTTPMRTVADTYAVSKLKNQADVWFLNLETTETVTQDGQTVTTTWNYDTDTTTGFVNSMVKGNLTVSYRPFYGGNNQGKVQFEEWKLAGGSQNYTYEYDYSSGAMKLKKLGSLRLLNRGTDASTGLVSTDCLPNGAGCTSYVYDAINRVKAVSPPNEDSTSITYTATTTTVEKGTAGLPPNPLAVYDYDGLGRLVREQRGVDTAGSPQQDTTYNAYGQIVDQTEWGGLGETSTVYDSLGRPSLVTTPDGTVTYEYSTYPTVAVTQSGTPNTTASTVLYIYDGLERLTDVVPCKYGGTCDQPGQFSSATAHYNYDQYNHVTEADLYNNTPGVKQVSGFKYSDEGYLLWETHPESGTTTYAELDALGNAHQRTDADGNVLTYDYDDAARVLSISDVFQGNPRLLVENAYDSDTNCGSTGAIEGRRCKGVRHNWDAATPPNDRTVTLLYGYYSQTGRLATIRTTIDGAGTLPSASFSSVGMNYGANGALASLLYPRPGGGQRLLSYGYANIFNNETTFQLQTIEDLYNSKFVVTDMGYNPAGGISSLATGSTQPYEWNNASESEKRNRASHITMSPTGGSPIFDITYGYDSRGNVQTIQGNGLAQTFHYDEQNRLVEADGIIACGTNINYTYDDFGNMTDRIGCTSAWPGAIQGRWYWDNKPQGSTTETFAFNQRGDQYAYWRNGQGPFQHWTFDGLDAVTDYGEAPQPGTTTTLQRYLYDADGQRVVVHDLASGRAYYYVRGSDGQVLSEFFAATNGSMPVTWQRDYVYAGSQHVAVVSPEPPGCLSGLNAVGSDFRIDLCFTQSTDPNVAGYEVFRKQDAPVQTALAPVGCVTQEFGGAAKDLVYQDYLNIERGATYTYEVIAFDAAGNRLPEGAGGCVPTAQATATGGRTTAQIGTAGVGMVITGPGPGSSNASAVRGWDASLLPVLSADCSFLAYPGTTGYGVNVATAALEDPSYENILTGPGPGPQYGPQVKGWKLGTGTSGNNWDAIAKINYYAYGTLRFGVNVTGADVDGDGYDEIITGAGPGYVFGPHVRGWNYDGTQVCQGNGDQCAIKRINYYAYAGALHYGVNVGAGNIDGDTWDEILTGPGPGGAFPAQVNGWNYDNGVCGAQPCPIAKVNFIPSPMQGFRYGSRPDGGDLDGDGKDEIAVAPGPDPGATPVVAAFNFDGVSLTGMWCLDVGTPPTHYGANVALGDVDGVHDPMAPSDEVAVGLGSDPSSDSMRTVVYKMDGTTHVPLQPPMANWVPYERTSGVASGFGVRVAVLSDVPKMGHAKSRSLDSLLALRGLVEGTPDGSAPDPSTVPPLTTNEWSNAAEKAVILQAIDEVVVGLPGMSTGQLLERLTSIENLIRENVINEFGRNEMIALIGELKARYTSGELPSPAVLAEVPVGLQPSEMALSIVPPQGVYVVSGPHSMRNVDKLDIASLTSDRIFTAYEDPTFVGSVSAEDVAVTPAGKLFVLAGHRYTIQFVFRRETITIKSLTVSLVDVDTLAQAGIAHYSCVEGMPCKLPFVADVLAVPPVSSSGAGKVYISMGKPTYVGLQGEILIVDGIDDLATAIVTAVETYPVSGLPLRVAEQLALSPIAGDHRIFMATDEGVDTLDTETDEVQKAVIPQPAFGLAVANLPSGQSVAYLATGAGITGVDLATYSVIGTSALSGATRVVLTPDKTLLAAAAGDGLAVVRRSDLSVLRIVPLASAANDLIATPDSSEVFASLASFDRVAVVYLQPPVVSAEVVNIATVINELPTSSFSGPSTQLKTALDNKLVPITTMVATAESMPEGPARDGILGAAENKLANDILTKTDGSVGGNPKNDWIVGAEAQAVVVALIQATTADLTELMTTGGTGPIAQFPDVAPDSINTGCSQVAWPDPTIPPPGCAGSLCPGPDCNQTACNTNANYTPYEYFVVDHLGSIRMVLDDNGNIRETHDFYPDGGEIFSAGSITSHKFTGHEFDSRSKLSYMHARYQGWNLARFLSPDVLVPHTAFEDPQVWNRYTYARNNPLAYVDRSGKDATLIVRDKDWKNPIIDWGHVAIRVTNVSHDVAFETWPGGPGYGSSMAIYSDPEELIADMQKVARVSMITFRTTSEQDAMIEAYFTSKAPANVKQPSRQPGHQVVKLKEQYDTFRNSCLTNVFEALHYAESATGGEILGFQELEEAYVQYLYGSNVSPGELKQDWHLPTPESLFWTITEEYGPLHVRQ